MLKFIFALAALATLTMLFFFLKDRWKRATKKRVNNYQKAYEELNSESGHIYKIANYTYKSEELKEKWRYEYPYSDIFETVITLKK